MIRSRRAAPALLLAATLLGGRGAAQTLPPVEPVQPLSVQGRSGLVGSPLPLPEPTRWTAATLGAGDKAFGLSAPTGASAALSQVSSTVFELSALEVSGLGNAGNAALEQELRANFAALGTLGDSQGRTVRLDVLSVTPAGTEVVTRWTEALPGPLPGLQPSGSGPAKAKAEVRLRGLLLAGGLLGPVQPSSPNPALEARYALLPADELSRLSLLGGAPYGTPLSAGERVSGVSEQNLLPLFTALLGAAPALQSWNLPALAQAGATLPPLTVQSERVYQGQNSRGDNLFQTQGRAQPWKQTLSGNGGSLTLEVPDMAQMSQAVYRADGLPGSAFEFSTLQLQVTAQNGAAQVRFAVQVRTTSALRPIGNSAGSASVSQPARPLGRTLNLFGSGTPS